MNVKHYLPLSGIFSYNKDVDFHDWISKKFIEWRGERIGRGSSVAEFGKLFGASQQVVSRWLSKDGDIPRSQKYISALVAVYGDEVYEVLEITKPSTDPFDQLPTALQSRIKSALAEINSIYATRSIPSDSPEALSVAVEVLAKFGFTIKDIE